MSYKSDLQAINTELEEILEAVNDLPDAIQRSPLPPEVSTEEEMKSILDSATKNDIGSIYKFIGKTSGPYIRGELYIIEEAK